jgi:hypothetical protein
MPGIESLVQNSQKLTTVFSAWPSFHDAEVVDLHFWRGDIKPGDWDERNVYPVLTVKIRVLEATQPGATGAGHDFLTTLRFHVVDDFKMDGFDNLNEIVDLSISPEERGGLVVQFERGCGIRMSFRCFDIEVVDVTACQGE